MRMRWAPLLSVLLSPHSTAILKILLGSGSSGSYITTQAAEVARSPLPRGPVEWGASGEFLK